MEDLANQAFAKLQILARAESDMRRALDGALSEKKMAETNNEKSTVEIMTLRASLAQLTSMMEHSAQADDELRADYALLREELRVEKGRVERLEQKVR